MYKKQRKNFQMTVKMIISDHVLGNILRTIEKRNWTLPSNIAPSNVHVYQGQSLQRPT